MLTHISIENYTLIDRLSIDLEGGFTTITGETGAGKSILLGALSLALGKRADLSSLRDKTRKCVIEVQFALEDLDLRSYFETHDLEYDPFTLIRREIHPNGKSRAFVNDSPVTLAVLAPLGESLIDVHSQHQTLRLTEHDFQLKLIDALAANEEVLDRYRRQLQAWRKTQKELEGLIELQSQSDREQDYNEFLYQELVAAELVSGMQESLESQHEKLSHAESILNQLTAGQQLLADERVGLLQQLLELRQNLSRISGFGKDYQELESRVNSVYIEMEDLERELESLSEDVSLNPEMLEATSQKLQKIYDLERKHQVSGVEELIEIREDLGAKINKTANLENEIAELGRKADELEHALGDTAELLRQRRRAVIPELKTRMEDKLHLLGMPNASFAIDLAASGGYGLQGADQLSFLFTANKGSDFGPLSKVASGGELSRIMLTIKSILASYEHLPTLVFDEIDSGVSGEISNRMGDIMQEMSANMQVISITHLPQVASKGSQHLKVFKEDEAESTHTRIRKLDGDERIVELAEMLGGKSPTDSAIAHARQLLN